MKLIMVDLDGTLFDTKEVNYLAYKEAIEPFGYAMDYGYYCAYCNGRHYLDFLPRITTDDLGTLEAIHARKKELYSRYLDKAVINRGLVEIIKRCSDDHKIALVTTASRQNAYDILEKFQMKGLFDLILTADDISNPKPDPEGYLKAMQYYRSLPEECMIFEDSEAGIEAAGKTGADVFVVKGYN